MTQALLTVNVGSSSVRFALFELDTARNPRPVTRGVVEGISAASGASVHVDGKPLTASEHAAPITNHDGALNWLLKWLQTNFRDDQLIAAGHRIVHGGDEFVGPVRIDNTVVEKLSRLIPLAPLHQPHNLAGVAILARALPALPQVACFDTAFHATQSSVARMIALPCEITSRGVKRYGFHGLSYEHIASVLPDILGERASGRVVATHLGSGASMCAIRERKSVTSTMGFSTLDGLMMGTRCGSIDPGVLLYLLQEGIVDVDGLADMLYRRSGLLGVSGISADMRTLLAAREASAAEAVALFCHRAIEQLGAMAAVLGGLDALVFTGGIGEHASAIRKTICEAVGWLGVALDMEKNEANLPCISTPNSRVAVHVIPADEELMIARHTARVLT